MAHVFKLLILFVLVQGVTPFSSVDSAFLPRRRNSGLGMYQEAKSLMNGEETVDEATKYIFTQICGLCVKKGVMGWRELEEMAEENDQLKLKVSSFVKLCLLLRHDESSSFLKALSVLEKGAGILQSQSRDVGERFASVIREYEKQLEEVCIITYKDTSPLSSSLAIISANAGDQQVREFLARQKVEVEGSQGKESPEDRREFSSCQRAWRMGWTNLQLLLQQDEEVEIEAILITDASPLGWGGLLISEGSTAEAEEEEEGGSGAGVHSREDGGKKRVLVRRAWGRFEEEEQEQERGGRKRGEQVDQATRELMVTNGDVRLTNI
ncbi:hypothetical protein GUITHDRAFT_149474 [Guillardia theta CCMP2712]|uniref:Uncharacterized protein n=1 Tax=Guillardia theta (strain CCMP2712) TaxID=905079 RepID=L1I5M1_GUITC|nr:hypothetical protein GUITHDRAFT_149474 [Guillardia theta CCMP2712]EKX31155.1 hypothetical protein GUITHDRAFT_149474 [Guillardia theta CCMP2712]|eukprot:XP_005818135.1 hypothetical protein GUITHDRAFT_149474 [Guillardia theta CCMP2712]